MYIRGSRKKTRDEAQRDEGKSKVDNINNKLTSVLVSLPILYLPLLTY